MSNVHAKHGYTSQVGLRQIGLSLLNVGTYEPWHICGQTNISTANQYYPRHFVIITLATRLLNKLLTQQQTGRFVVREHTDCAANFTSLQYISTTTGLTDGNTDSVQQTVI